MGPTPLTGSLAWEGVEKEEFQAGRGLGVYKACVHYPQYLATKIPPGVPPYFTLFENFLGLLQPLLGTQSPPYPPPPPPRVFVGVRGRVRPFRTLRPKVRQGFPLIFLRWS